MPDQPSPVVLVHGAWHGPWCWDRVTPLLHDRGIEFYALDLPSMNVNAEQTGLQADTASLRKALDAIDRPAVVVGHSYGGGVITEGAAEHPNAKHLVYLTAFMPDVGESINGLLSQHPNPEFITMIQLDANRRSVLDPARVGPILYNDCSDDVVAWATDRLRSMATDVGRPTPKAAWHTIPSTYVVCTEDRAILPALQRDMAKHASHVVEWPTSHSPFASRPKLVADLLTELAG
jgi:pimeloyl-ACP methyl ester carboxylesterase